VSFVGLGFVIVGLAPSGGHPPIWPPLLGLFKLIVGTLGACALRLRPARYGPNPHEAKTMTDQSPDDQFQRLFLSCSGTLPNIIEQLQAPEADLDRPIFIDYVLGLETATIRRS
jgi:hypothetical protein